MAVKIYAVSEGSIAEEIGLNKGDTIISINKNDINDVLDYDFYCKDEVVLIEFKKRNDIKVNYIEVEKDVDEELGLEFETFLIDKQHTCTNKCIFCFVDQMPKGLRESLYFRDDDERMSFLFGSYITMTNMKQSEVDRIIKMKISPINISVHSTDREIRKRMLVNRFSDRTLKYLKQLNEAGIKVNCQIVLCKGINDGDNLVKTINDLTSLKNSVESIAVVPVGITKFRDNLPEVKCFFKEDSIKTIELIHNMSEKLLKERGSRIVFPADEFFLKAEIPIPENSYYEEYKQLDNGVGMLRLLEEEFKESLKNSSFNIKNTRNVSIITGEAPYELILKLANMVKEKYSNVNVNVHKVKNNFFGGNVIVAGLITGTDIKEQIKKKDLYNNVLIPSSMLKYGEDRFLDEFLVSDIEKYYNVTINTVENDGYELLEKIVGEE